MEKGRNAQPVRFKSVAARRGGLVLRQEDLLASNAACKARQKMCMGDNLVECKDDLTGWDSGQARLRHRGLDQNRRVVRDRVDRR